MEFQSLLCWNWLPGRPRRRAGGGQRLVSILVVLELATRQYYVYDGHHRLSAFQSLLCWNWLPGTYRFNDERRASLVSILVVLELATRPVGERERGRTDLLFQS